MVLPHEVMHTEDYLRDHVLIKLGLEGNSNQAKRRRASFRNLLHRLVFRAGWTSIACIGSQEMDQILQLIYKFNFLPQDVRSMFTSWSQT